MSKQIYVNLIFMITRDGCVWSGYYHSPCPMVVFFVMNIQWLMMIMILPVTRWFSCPSNSPFHHCMDFTELLHGFVEIDRWTSLNYYMDLSNLIHGFLKIDTWIFLRCYMNLLKLFYVFFPLCQTKLKLKFDQDFKAC